MKIELHHRIAAITNSSSGATRNITYSYDDLDRPVSRGNSTFAYNARGEVSRLVSVSELRCLDIDNPTPSNWVEVVVASNSYDYAGRRVSKTTESAAHTYFYDGWLLVKEVVAHTNGANDIVEYHWGNDLSGSRTGAAGIGGLLYLTISNSNSQLQLYVHFYDAYGNVVGYWDEFGNVVAEYAYDAFGNTVSKSGYLADIFSLRYSTKYYDVESNLYYYGYRFYSPALMRWLTRDPIVEDGGENLYAHCENNGISKIDLYGDSAYIVGENEHPRRNTLVAGTWNTMKAPMGAWIIRVRAKLTAVGGNLRSMPDAARHLQHFLGNTGAPLQIRFVEMNRESNPARLHLQRELRDAIANAERLSNSNGHFIMVTANETTARNDRGNWFLLSDNIQHGQEAL